MSFFASTFGASADAYLLSEPRASLLKKENCVVLGYEGPWTLSYNDAGNFPSCQPGVGPIVGTCRDISACAYADELGRIPTAEEMANISYETAAGLYKKWFKELRLNELSDQDVANITMHIGMHFGMGNMRVVQNALLDLGENVTVDGRWGQQSIEALKRQTRKDSAKTYNAIRSRLAEAYGVSSTEFRAGFVNALKHFPEKKTSNWLWVLAAILVLILLIIITIFIL